MALARLDVLDGDLERKLTSEEYHHADESHVSANLTDDVHAMERDTSCRN